MSRPDVVKGLVFPVVLLVLCAGESGRAVPSTGPATTQALETPAEQFDRAFGAEYRRCRGGPPTVRLALARKLLATANDPAAFLGPAEVLCERAAILAAVDRTGYPTALRALQRLRALRPDRAVEYDQRIVAVLEKLYAARTGAERAVLAGPYSAALLKYAQDAATRPSMGPTPETYAVPLVACQKAGELTRTLTPDRAAVAADVTLQIANRQHLARRVAELKAKAEAGHGDDDSMEELAVLLLGVFDDPAAALDYARRAPGSGPLERVRTAVAPPEKLSDARWGQRADWFRTWGEKLAGPAGPYLLGRAVDEYAGLLTQRSTPGPFRVQVLASAERACAARARRTAQGTPAVSTPAVSTPGVSTPAVSTPAVSTSKVAADIAPRPLFLPPPRGRFILACAALDQPVAGAWQRRAGGVSAETALGKALLGIAAAPPEDYEIVVDFTARGATGIGLALPVGAGCVDLLRGDAECGLGQVQGAWKRFDPKLPPLGRDTFRHTLYAKVSGVDPAVITVRLDGAAIGSWTGKPADLTPIPAFVPPNPGQIGLCVREGAATFHSVCLVAAPFDNLRTAPSAVPDAPDSGLYPTDIPADGTRPADAVVSITATAGTVSHNLVTLTVDGAQLRPVVKVSAADPSPEFHAVHAGFTTMMAAPANVAELRIGVPEYQRLITLSQTAPACCADADLARLGTLYHQCATALGEEEKEAAEHNLFMALHQLGEDYRKTCSAWVRQVQEGTSPAEFRLIVKFGGT